MDIEARCSKCGSPVDGDPKFCSSCGAPFVPIPPPISASANDQDLFYCYRHKKEATRIACGRCGRPLCPKCLVIGPAGVRCKACAKGRIKLRPRGLAHDVAWGVSSLFSSLGRKPLGFWIAWGVLAFILSGSFCGRRHF